MTENERMKPVRTVISMTAAEFSLLAQLVFLGNYVVNGCRSPQEELGEYNALADMIYRERYAQTTGIRDREEIEDNEIADVRDRLYDEVREYLEAFEEDVLREGAFGKAECAAL